MCNVLLAKEFQDELPALAKSAIEVSFPKGTVIISQHDEGENSSELRKLLEHFYGFPKFKTLIHGFSLRTRFLCDQERVSRPVWLVYCPRLEL